MDARVARSDRPEVQQLVRRRSHRVGAAISAGPLPVVTTYVPLGRQVSFNGGGNAQLLGSRWTSSRSPCN